jgi:prephenate dehydrogenase
MIAVVGPGLIGRSVSLAARRADPEARVIEIDRGDSLDAAAGADVIVLAAPVDAILEIIRSRAELLRGSVTLDTGSTKQAIVYAARDAGLERFIGGHPMAGGATSGPDCARADLFDGRPWFLIPHRADPEALIVARGFVERLRATPVVLDDDGALHDRVMAAVSHLPQVVSSALIAVAGSSAGEHLAWAGEGLVDTTRLADSSASMWQGILATNTAALAPLLRRLAATLSEAADHLDDPVFVRALFDRAQHHRQRLLGKH